MAAGTKNELVHCDKCGEDYSATYKRCPFCEENAGARRNTRGGGYGGSITPTQIIAVVASIALIAVAVWIVYSVVGSMIGGDNKIEADPDLPAIVTPIETDDDDANQTPDDTIDTPIDDDNQGEDTLNADDNANTDDNAVDTPASSTDNNSTPDRVGTTVTLTALTLSMNDFSLTQASESHRLTVTATPASDSLSVTWTTADASVATVSSDGVVTAVGNGTTTITASAGGLTAECIVRVRNQATNGGSGTSASSSGATSSSLTINRDDMTLSVAEVFTLTITGADSVTWTSSNSAVASVDASGRVTGVAAGTATITATANGENLSCIVRVR